MFFLPGYMLVNLLFPRKGELDPEYDQVYRVALGMGMSVVIAILVGFGLNAISTEEHGYVSSGPLWISLSAVMLAFFLLGWFRGAYPWLGAIHHALYRPPRAVGMPGKKPSDYARKQRIGRLLLERERLLKDMMSFSDVSSTSNPKRKLYYRKRMDATRERIAQINKELESAGKGES